MLVRKMLRWAVGSAEFTAEGGFPERFITLMDREGITAQYLYPTQLGLRGAVRPGLYKRLHPIARRTGMRMRICGRKGMPFLLYRYHRRTGLMVGVILLALMLLVMQLFVWQVTVTGCEELDEEAVLENLRDVGVYPGAFIPSIDAFRCERDMMMQVPELAWIAVNIQGSTIEVKLRERVMPPAAVDRENAAANVISGGTGVVREMEVYSGQPLIKVGEAVWEGRLLVAGIFESNLHTIISYARAKVIIETQETVTIEVPLSQTIQQPTGAQVHRWLLETPEDSFQLNFWTEQPENAWVTRKSWKLPFGLPGIVAETYEIWEPRERVYTQEEARSEALRLLGKEETARFPDGFLERTLSGGTEDGVYRLTGSYTCLRDAAVTQEVLLDQ